MDDKQASNTKLNDRPTCREYVTSSPRLPAAKSEKIKNRFASCGRQEKTFTVDKATKQNRTPNEPAAENLLTPESRTAIPETEIRDNTAVKNGTSNENYIRFADDEDLSSASCEDEVDETQYNCVSIRASNNCDSFQTSGSRLLNTFLFFFLLLWTHAQRCVHVIFCRCFFIFFYARLSWPHG